MGSTRMWLHALSRAALVSALVGVGITVVSAQAASAEDAVLEGTYKLDFGGATADGAPSSLPLKSYWYVFQTDCASGCIAIGDQMNTNDRSGPYRDFSGIVSFQFLDGQWFRSGQYDMPCADGSVVRFMWSWMLTPQADGSLTGTRVIDPSGRCAEFAPSFTTQAITATRQG